MNTNSTYLNRKRVLEETTEYNVNSKRRGAVGAFSGAAEGLSFPTPNDSLSSTNAPAFQDQEEQGGIEAEAIDVLSSFSKRGSKLEVGSTATAPLSLHLPFPNSRWRIPFDSPDSLSFLIPSPKSSTRSDASDLPFSHTPCKALIALLSKELDLLISSLYVRSVAPKSQDTRLVMLNWIYDISKKRKYLPETAYIAVTYYDRYMEKNRVRIFKQQKLIALTCIFIAAKMHEELEEPLISEMLAFSELFNASDLKRMERKVVSFFDFNLSCITPLTILDECFHSIGYPEARYCSFSSPYYAARFRIERLLNPLLKKVQSHLDLCSVRPSILLRTCLEFLEFQRSVGKLGAEIFQIAMMLPSVDEDLRSKIFAVLH